MKTGIWLDTEKAFIIELQGDEADIERLDSEVEHFNVHGGSGSSTPWGPQDATSDHKILERKKHQLHNYYQRIIERVKAAEQLYIFGPAEAKNGLQKELAKLSSMHEKVMAVDTADSMTENQMKAYVRNYYNQA